MGYPKRRGIYYLREDPEAGLYIWIRHRPAGEVGGRKRKFGRKLKPYFDDKGWKIPKHLTDRRLMAVVLEIREEINTTSQPLAMPIDTTPLVELIGTYGQALDARGANPRYVSEQRRRLRAALGLSKVLRRAKRLDWTAVKDLRRADLEEHLEQRRGFGMSAEEVNHDLRTWRAFASWLVKRGRLPVNPFQGLEAFRDPEGPPKVLSPAELARFLKACRWPGGMVTSKGRKCWAPAAPAWLEAAVRLMMYTGMRPVEVARLRWETVDLRKRTITVLRKGGRNWVIPMARGLQAWLKGTPKQKRRGPVVPGFPYDETGAMPGNYSRAVRVARRRAGLEGVTLYWLRHSVATHLAQSGVSAAQLQAIMGHRSFNTTKRYVRLAAEGLHKAVDGLPWRAE